MSAMLNVSQKRRFTTGWVILMIAAGLMTLNHALLIVVLDTAVLFLGYAAFSLYALLVIALPFRHRAQWAWYTTWLLPIGLAAAAVFAHDPNIAPFYYVVAAACVLGLLLTMQDFFALNGKVAS